MIRKSLFVASTLFLFGCASAPDKNETEQKSDLAPIVAAPDDSPMLPDDLWSRNIGGEYCNTEDINRAIALYSHDMRYCFEEQLRHHSSLSGQVTLAWLIELDGSTSNVRVVESEIDNQQMENCLVVVFESIRFAKPNGGFCRINYPFVFGSSHDDDD